jgi:hypothetical protein
MDIVATNIVLDWKHIWNKPYMLFYLSISAKEKEVLYHWHQIFIWNLYTITILFAKSKNMRETILRELKQRMP